MKTVRFIGMALLSIILSVNFIACSDDDKKELIENIENEDENENKDENEDEDGLIKTIHVEQAGTLKDLMTEEEQSQVTNLTLSGYLNGTDIYFISQTLNLTKIDLTDAHIVGGGRSYSFIIGDIGSTIRTTSTSDNVFPAYFIRNTNLREIKLPNSVTTIEEYAFYGCTSLTTIEIPNSVTTIDRWTFAGCTSLTTIEIPNSVTTIEEYAFYGCTSLTSVEIPNSVTTIEKGAFKDCTLKEIHIKGSTPPTVDDDTFSTFAYTTLFVPAGSKDAYMEHRVWGKFSNTIEE